MRVMDWWGKNPLGSWLLVQGAALVMASLAGFINGIRSAPYLLGVACCSMALGAWLRANRPANR